MVGGKILDDDFGDYDEAPGIGCANCESGWRHGCMDDLCRSGADAAEDCESAVPCGYCNPNGE